MATLPTTPPPRPNYRAKAQKPAYAAIMSEVNGWLQDELPSLLGKGVTDQSLTDILNPEIIKIPENELTIQDLRHFLQESKDFVQAAECSRSVREYVNFRLAAANQKITFTPDDMRVQLETFQKDMARALERLEETSLERKTQLQALAAGILEQIDSILIENGVDLNVQEKTQPKGRQP